ncbi:MAG: DUF362 domain-containing protein, partial [Candidatus Thermoplasmatota archaeon]|nr:DUF362 domain-containing protein [Candidatus Thermoplasmatota archaeon]
GVEKAVWQTLKDLGGIGAFVSPGETVFLKLNLLLAQDAAKAITTHPVVINAVIRILEKQGAHVVVGDSPGGPYTKWRLEQAYKKTGVYEAVEGTGAEVNLDLETVRVSNPGGKLVKSFEVIKPVLETDKIVALPKLKTHVLTGFTGGVKVMYGVIPGIVKTTYHSNLPKVEDFSDMLLDLYLLVKPDLLIMDGVVGMEGQGPSGGDAKKAGFVLASADGVAMDIAACRLIGLGETAASTTRAAIGRGLISVEDVESVGDEVLVTPFKSAAKKKNMFPVPRFMLDFYAKRHGRPMASKDKCTRCGECAEACPRECIAIKDRAVMDYNKCIKCYCCHELCPEQAIYVK